MLITIFYSVIAFFFIAACDQLPSANPKAPQPKSEEKQLEEEPKDKKPARDTIPKEHAPPSPGDNNPPVPPQPQGLVKDTTAFPALAKALPDLSAAPGWKKTLSTPSASIPDKEPSPPQEFFIAQKNIEGRDRTIAVVFGDIRQESDAIVNAANSGLEGGGGIDGAIHNAAKVNGKDLLVDEAKAYKALHKISSFPTGSAMVMNPYGLGPKISMIVFTVGPQGDSTPAKDLELYSAVYNSLLKAQEFGAQSISIPTISTGIYGFPLARAAELYFGAILKFFYDHPKTSIDTVRLMDLTKAKIQQLGARFDVLFR